MFNKIFENIPLKYSSIIDNIQSEIVTKIYSKFKYLYLNFQFVENCKDSEQKLNKENVEDSIFDYLRNFKFITYNIYNYLSNISELSMNCINISNKNSIFNKTDIIFCVENQCIIIENIDFQIIKRIILKLKNHKASLINLSSKKIDKYETLEEENANEEILNFCDKIDFDKSNKFIFNTITPISGYLVRRYFYPTNYFIDQSFFDFDEVSNTNERILKSEFINLLNSKSLKTENFLYIKNKANIKKHCIDFKEDNFIFLRTLASSQKAIFYLVIHIDSLYVFAMKKLRQPEQISSEKLNETKFNRNYSHRCLIHFYGFLKDDNDNITGYIYEFMCNGPLNSLKLVNNDKLLNLTIINRILQGVDYLHTNKLIYRDLKTSNILFDHDFLPYISDFETIRHPKEETDSDQPITTDIGCFKYSSPEQYKGENISYPTDIYSLVLIIYFIYHQENLNKCYDVIDSINKRPKIQTEKFSKNIQLIFDQCYKIKPEERLNINQIKSIFNIEINDFLCEDFNLIDKKTEIYHFIYESLIIQNEINDLFISLIYHFLTSLEDENHKSYIFYTIGLMYMKGICVERNYVKAKDFFEKSAELNNSDAMNQIGIVYENGFDVEKDYKKAKQYYISSAQQNNSDGICHLAYLYFHGLGVKQNYKKSIKFYEKAAELNNQEALDNLGYIYKNGIGVKPDYKKAKNFYELAAKQNNSYALNNLGNLYRDGLGVEIDYAKAKEYYKLSIKQDNKFAFHNIGTLYEFGMGVEQNYDKAIEYYKQAAKHQNTKSLNNLAYFYFHGIGVNQSYTKARKYYERSAEKNNSYALINLGIIYANGLGVDQSFSKAKEYYDLAIKRNNIDAYNNLGNLYTNGLGCKIDYEKAIEYYKLAKKEKNTDALVYLGNLYSNGFGVEKNFTKAKKYYEKSAKQNNSKAFNCLGVLYEKGYGVDQSYSKAIEYYEIAAKMNNSSAFYNLGYLYENGFGIPKSYSKAKEYYEISAQQSNPEAFNSLGILYAYGLGVDKNYSKAKKYFELAIKHKNTDALNNLAYLYINGLGVEQSYSIAKKLFESAAEQNNSDAFVNLGILYKKGYGVEQSYSKAKNYFELAAEQSNSKGLNNLACLYYFGLGVEQSYSKAREYYESSAKLNDATALNNLGYIYLQGLNVSKNFLKSKEYFELAIKQNNLISYINLGDIYSDEIYVKLDYSRAMNYYEKATNYNNSEALYKIGNLSFNGDKKDKLKALKYYEKSAEMNHSEALKKLGDIYFYEKYYQKAMIYYVRSSLQENSDALFQIGQIYFNEKNFFKVEEYYILSTQYKNPDAFFFLGEFYSNNEFFEQNNFKAIKYYIKSIQVHYDKMNLSNNVDKISYDKNIYNNYYYHSLNSLGLIYLIMYDDIEKAYQFIRNSANGEFPFGQNNYGILNEIYLNNINDAEYMYKKASKSHNFALAEFNLGRLKEKDGKLTEESIEHYKKASDYENLPLRFRDREYRDKRLEISKSFIICLANLILIDHFLSISNYTESKNYFIRVLNKLQINELVLKSGQNYLMCLRNCILNYPSFNLMNQENLSPKIKELLINCNNKMHCIIRNNHDLVNLNEYDKKFETKQSMLLENDLKEDFGDIFHFISNREFKNIFIKEIKEIIKIMKEIIYTPPYPILFGRINIAKPKAKTKIKNINELFYEGFGFK